jgi:hypothetical protein
MALCLCGCSMMGSAPGPAVSVPGGPATSGTAEITLSSSATVRAPARWHTSTYRGEPATVYFPIRFLSTDPLTGPCTTGSQKAACTTQNWFPDGWRTPADGVILLWSHAEFPQVSGPALNHQPGRLTTIDHRAAKVWTGPATGHCPDGARTETDASVRQAAHSHPGERFDLVACFGPTATSQDRSDVARMLHSLRVRASAS